MTPEQLAEIERSWRNRPTAVYLYDRKRGLMNATTVLSDNVTCRRIASRKNWLSRIFRALPCS
jgi:hypothetical protein